jgi:phosphoglycerate dehydrogenase-like enzyme
MAEHFFALLLALTRQVPDIVRRQDRREWSPEWRAQAEFSELRGKTLSIIGWGKIGEQVAHVARAFGMRVIGTRRSAEREQPLPRVPAAHWDPPRLEVPHLPPDMCFPPDRLNEVLSHSDIVLLILPLTDETRGSFGREQFEAMPRGALFFNIGRGAVVDQEALVTSLESGRVAGAGLDVFADEPLPPSSPLWRLPNVIVSPHVGGNSPETDNRAAHLFAINLEAYLSGRPLLNVVDRISGY